MKTQQTLTNLFCSARSHIIFACIIHRHTPSGNSRTLLRTADCIHITVQEQTGINTCAPLKAPIPPASHSKRPALKLAGTNFTQGNDRRWPALETGRKARRDQFSRDSELSAQEQGMHNPVICPSRVHLPMTSIASKENYNVYSENESEGREKRSAGKAAHQYFISLNSTRYRRLH
jgi:hypothetical protein